MNPFQGLADSILALRALKNRLLRVLNWISATQKLAFFFGIALIYINKWVAKSKSLRCRHIFSRNTAAWLGKITPASGLKANTQISNGQLGIFQNNPVLINLSHQCSLKRPQQNAALLTSLAFQLRRMQREPAWSTYVQQALASRTNGF